MGTPNNTPSFLAPLSVEKSVQRLHDIQDSTIGKIIRVESMQISAAAYYFRMQIAAGRSGVASGIMAEGTLESIDAYSTRISVQSVQFNIGGMISPVVLAVLAILLIAVELTSRVPMLVISPFVLVIGAVLWQLQSLRSQGQVMSLLKAALSTQAQSRLVASRGAVPTSEVRG